MLTISRTFVFIIITCSLTTITVNNVNNSKGICSLTPITGPCRALVLRWYYNMTSSTCQQFLFGGCKGNENNFITRDECLFNCHTLTTTGDVCRQDMTIGPCRGSIPRFWYNYRKRKCEKFTYGGCRGNGNNFIDEIECQKKCGEVGDDKKEKRTNDRIVKEEKF